LVFGAEATEHRQWVRHRDYYRSRSASNKGLKIDFVLASPTLADRVTGASIDREERLDMSKPGPSDHAPVVVDLSD